MGRFVDGFGHPRTVLPRVRTVPRRSVPIQLVAEDEITHAVCAGTLPIFPHHTVRAAPVGHGQIARVSPAGARLFVRIHMRETGFAAQRVEHGTRLARANQQGQPARAERGAQFGQTAQSEIEMLRIEFRAGEPLRLDHINRKCPRVCGSSGKRSVVMQAQIAFEPDESGRHSPSLGDAGFDKN